MAYFFAVGTPVLPVTFDETRKEARFTLQDRNDRLYVVTTTLSQYEEMKRNPNVKMLILGALYSFRDPKGSHRIGLKPMLMEPLNGSYDRDLFHRLVVHLIEHGIENDANGH